MIGERLGAVGIICAGDQVAARSDDFILWDGDFHVEGAEVGEEFSVGVKLMAVPGVFPPDADFREPLADHVEIVGVAGAFNDFGKHVVEGDVEFDGRAGGDGFRQRDLHDGVVFGVVIIGLNELQFVGQIAGAFDF